MASTTNSPISVPETLADLLQIKGEPVFKAIAFQKVSRCWDTRGYPQGGADGTLAEMEGIGPSSRRIIEQYAATGHSDDFDQVSAACRPDCPHAGNPRPGGQDRRQIWKERDIKSLEELVRPSTRQIAGLERIGDKKIEQIKQGIALRAPPASAWGSSRPCRWPRRCWSRCAGFRRKTGGNRRQSAPPSRDHRGRRSDLLRQKRPRMRARGQGVYTIAGR
jgi:hypothetical protein